LAIRAQLEPFVEKLYGNIDVAVKNVMEAQTFDDVLQEANATLEIVDDQEAFRAIVEASQSTKLEAMTSDTQPLRVSPPPNSYRQALPIPSGGDTLKVPVPVFESVKECLKKQVVFGPTFRTLSPGPYNELPSMRTCVHCLSGEPELLDVLTAEIAGIIPALNNSSG